MHHGSVYLVTRLAGASFQLVLLLFLTRTLSPDAYGRLALFTSAFSLAVLFLFNPWRHALVRFWPEQPENLPLFLSHMGMGLLVSGGIWLCLVILIWIFWLSAILSSFWGGALTVAVLAAGWVETGLEQVRRSLTPFSYARLFLFRSFFQLVLAWGGWWLTGQVEGVVAGIVSSHLLAMLITFWQEEGRQWLRSWQQPVPGWRDALTNLKTWQAYGFPLAMAELVSLAMIQTDRAMIAVRLGLEPTGLYTAAHDLAWMGLQVISVVAYLAFFPLVVAARSRQDKVAADRLMADGFSLLFGLGLASTLGLVLLSASVAGLVLGQEFRQGAARLIALVAIMHLIHVSKVYWIDLGFTLNEKTWPLLLSGLAGIVFNVVLNFFFLPLYGVSGAALATGLATLVSLVISWQMARYMQLACYRVCWPDIARILLAALMMGLVLLGLPEAVSFVGLGTNVITGASVFMVALWFLRLSLFRRKFL